MNGKIRFLMLAPCVLGASALAACSDPSNFDNNKVEPPTGEEEELCPAHGDWLPETPEFASDPTSFFKPAPHPEGECPFYSLAVQNFLWATQPQKAFDGTPRIKLLPTIDDIFEHLTPLPAGALAADGQPRGTRLRSWLGDIKQAGQREVAIDQNGRTLYYGLHVNQAFVDFLKDEGLTTAKAVQEAPDDLFFPPGLLEIKTSWQQYDDDADGEGYVHTTAWVPTISVDKSGGAPSSWKLVEDRDHPKEVKVRLINFHSVVTFPGHPEFLWGHIEHSSIPMDTDDTNVTDYKAELGFRDIAPITSFRDTASGSLLNPDPNDSSNAMINAPVVDTTGEHSEINYVLYKKGTPTNLSNKPFSDNELAQAFDEPSQRFMRDGQPLQTSIYRIFPASKSNTTDPDAAISALNRNLEALFRAKRGALAADDFRRQYRLAGAQWMDKPHLFALNSNLQNTIDGNPLLKNNGDIAADLEPFQAHGPEGREGILAAGSDGVQDILANGSDSPFSQLAGEDRLSGVGLESFTQSNAFANCFTCHNTQAIASNGVPYKGPENGHLLMPPKLLNVSHILSQLVLEQCDGPNANVVTVGSLPEGSILRRDFVNSNISGILNAQVALCPSSPAAPTAAAK